jgi:hypothetical protein
MHQISETKRCVRLDVPGSSRALSPSLVLATFTQMEQSGGFGVRKTQAPCLQPNSGTYIQLVDLDEVGFAASKDLLFTTIRMRGLAQRGRGESLRSNLLHLGTAHFTGACRP